MSLELVNAIASVGTFLVIGATAIAAVIQLRHMRANNQLEGLLNVLAHLEDESFNKWFTDTQRELPALLADPAYLKSIRDGTFDRNVSWLQLANRYERAGSLLKFGLIPEGPFLDVNDLRAIRAWELLVPLTSVLRSISGPSLWENFEYLYVRAKVWAEQHKDGNYPKGVPRAELPAFELPVAGRTLAR
jgi:hypothetical protein